MLCSSASDSSVDFQLSLFFALCMECIFLFGPGLQNQSGKTYRGWWVWGWNKRRSQQWLMRPQPTCTVARVYEVAYGNCWWLMFDGGGRIAEHWWHSLSVGDF